MRALALAVRVSCIMRPLAWQLPPAALRAFRAIRAQEDMDDFGAGGMGPRPPSDKQISYAQGLATKLSRPIPDVAFTDAQECSRFIDEALNHVPPTERQIAFATTLAQQKGIELPAAATLSSSAVSAFIEQHKQTLNAPYGAAPQQPSPFGAPPMQYGGAPAQAAPFAPSTYGSGGQAEGMPSDKQLAFAISLARQQKIGLSYEALSDKAQCSLFIEELLQQKKGAPPPPPASGTSPGYDEGAIGAAAAAGSFGGAAYPADELFGPSSGASADLSPLERDLFGADPFAAQEGSADKPADGSFQDEDIPF